MPKGTGPFRLLYNLERRSVLVGGCSFIVKYDNNSIMESLAVEMSRTMTDNTVNHKVSGLSRGSAKAGGGFLKQFLG